MNDKTESISAEESATIYSELMLTVRAMQETDINNVSSLRVRGWRTTYASIIPVEFLNAMSIEDDARQRRDRFASSGDATNLVAVDNRDTVIGWICFGPYRGETEADSPGEVYALYVEPSLIGKGIGRELLGAAHRYCESRNFNTIYLWVLRDNSRARKFYEAAGYAMDGAVQSDLYGNEEVPELRYRWNLAK